MKQSVFRAKLSSLFSQLDLEHKYILDGFHPDLFLTLFLAIEIPIILVFPNHLFDEALKYLSVLTDDERVAFVPPALSVPPPSGFLSQSALQLRRSKELFSRGTSRVSFIVCAESGLSVPLVGSGGCAVLRVTAELDFYVCVDFYIFYWIALN